jgi:hypothetical protein
VRRSPLYNEWRSLPFGLLWRYRYSSASTLSRRGLAGHPGLIGLSMLTEYAQDDRFCRGGKWPGPTPVEKRLRGK